MISHKIVSNSCPARTAVETKLMNFGLELFEMASRFSNRFFEIVGWILDPLKFMKMHVQSYVEGSMMIIDC